MSTKKTIYLIRHGQTDYNLKGIVQGSGIDSDLNELGRQQAKWFHEHYGHVGFDHIFTSELKRTIQSVSPFLDAGHDHTVMPELNEINWGVFEGKPVTPESKKRFHEIIMSWRQGELNIPIEGGESPVEMYQRQEQGWDKIAGSEHKTILICMHGRALRSFLSLIMRTPLHEMDEYDHSNLCLYVIEKDGDRIELSVRNDVSHLAIPS